MHMRLPGFCPENALAIITAFILSATLGACSPDSGLTPGAGAPVADLSAAPEPDASPDQATAPKLPPYNGAGIWLGKLTRDGEFLNRATCLMTDGGDIGCALYNDEAQAILVDPVVGAYGVPTTARGGVSGTVRLEDLTRLSGSGTLYAAPGQVLPDGSSRVAPFTITGGTLTDTDLYLVGQRLNLTFSSLGEIFELEADFDHYYLRAMHGLSLNSGDWIQGVYTTFSIFDDPASLSIDADGMLFSESATACVLSGHIGIIEWDYNGYAVDLTMENCGGLSGSYKGLALLSDFLYVNGTDNLLIVAFNNSGFIAGEARKYDRTP